MLLPYTVCLFGHRQIENVIEVEDALRADLEKNQTEYEVYYDSVELCEESATAHPKAAVQIRNRIMVERSDLCVFYVTHPSGGAYQTKQYAEAAGKPIISLDFSR